MARCQRHELLAPAVEERIIADDERAGLQLDEGCEGGVDLASVLAFRIASCTPFARAASCTSLDCAR